MMTSARLMLLLPFLFAGTAYAGGEKNRHDQRAYGDRPTMMRDADMGAMEGMMTEDEVPALYCRNPSSCAAGQARAEVQRKRCEQVGKRAYMGHDCPGSRRMMHHRGAAPAAPRGTRVGSTY